MIFYNLVRGISPFVLLLSTTIVYASEMIHFKGSVVTFDNQSVEGLLCQQVSSDFTTYEPIPAKVRLYVPNNAGVVQAYELPTADISKIIYSGKRYSGGDTSTNFVVVLKNGKVIEQIQRPALLMPNRRLYVSARHPITGALAFDRITWDKVKELRLHETFGQVRRDAYGNVFPADYEFSPFTGAPMELYVID